MRTPLPPHTARPLTGRLAVSHSPSAGLLTTARRVKFQLKLENFSPNRYQPETVGSGNSRSEQYKTKGKTL